MWLDRINKDGESSIEKSMKTNWNSQSGMSDELNNIIFKELKQKISVELEKKEFPNLKFLYSQEVIENSLDILEEFLQEEKKYFKNSLKTKNEDIDFDLFNIESKLDYFWSLLYHLKSVKSSDKIRSVIDIFEPKITEFSNEVSYSKRNYEMLEVLLSSWKLNQEQEKIIKDEIMHYKVRWINLNDEKQEELKKINLEISEISTKFSNNILDSKKEFEYHLDNDDFLKEMPKSDLENAKSLAKKKWKHWFVFDASSSSYIAIMKYCSNSQIRKYFSRVFNSFASEGDYDNRENILKLINLKNKKAKILWYENYWELSLEFKMVENSKEIIDLISDIAKKAKTKGIKEIEEIKEFFNLESINSWDLSYYFRLLKEKKYKLDDKKLKQYFEFENTKNSLFNTVKRLYGIEMKKISSKNDSQVSLDDNQWFIYNEGVEIYEVYKQGEFISYFVWDYFYNEDKTGGAWADRLRWKYKDKKAILSNTTNIVKSESWPTLLTLSEVETLFHEFGHAIHDMLSKSEYSDLSGLNVEWDFVELPSQILEKWCSDYETINDVASHYETWEKLNEDMLKSIENLKHFSTWNSILWQNIYAICDMMFYSWESFENIWELDAKFLDKVNSLAIFKKDEKYKQYCSFSHIFDGGYSAWYYSYMRADIIVSEVWEVFKQNWVYDEGTAQKFEKTILWAGSLKKAREMFFDFMARDVEIDAFLEEKGLL